MNSILAGSFQTLKHQGQLIGIQLAKAAGPDVIATASRPETASWVRELGADHVVNHREPMVEQVRALGFHHVDPMAIFNDMRHWETAVELIRPQGGIVTIDDTDLPMPMAGMKMKAASFYPLRQALVRRSCGCKSRSCQQRVAVA